MLIVSFLALFLASMSLTYCLYKYSLKKNIIDIPNERSSHHVPVPRGGGLVVVLLFYAVLCGIRFFYLIDSPLFYALLGGIPVAIVGYVDDVRQVNSFLRLVIHLITAIWAVIMLKGGGGYYFGPHLFYGNHLSLQSILAIVVFVWFINFYNFMDGIDGLAAIETMFLCAVMAALFYFLDFFPLAYLFVALAVITLGFYVWNRTPAKIFMGDVCSGFLGYVFATFMWYTNLHKLVPVEASIILIAPFFYDATYTLLLRMLQGKQWYAAHREHAYQRIVQLGVSHGRVCFWVLILNLFVCLPLAIIGVISNYGLLLLLLMSSLSFMIWLSIVYKQHKKRLLPIKLD